MYAALTNASYSKPEPAITQALSRMCEKNPQAKEVHTLTHFNTHLNNPQIHSMNCQTKDEKVHELDSCAIEALGSKHCGFPWHEVPTYADNWQGTSSVTCYNQDSKQIECAPQLSAKYIDEINGNFSFKIEKWCSDQKEALKEKKKCNEDCQRKLENIRTWLSQGCEKTEK